MKQSILQNKKGVSMLELIAYVVLSGSVMALLATMVSFIATATNKIFAKSKLNTESVQLYTLSLSVTNNLMPDTVELITDATTGKKTVMLWKKYAYIAVSEGDDDTEKKQVLTDSEATLTNTVNKLYFTFNDTTNDIVITTSTPSGLTTTNALSVSQVTLSDVDFDVIVANSANTFVKISGKMTCTRKTQSFSYILPVFTTSIETE